MQDPSTINLLIVAYENYAWPAFTTVFSVRSNVPPSMALNCFIIRYQDDKPADYKTLKKILSKTDKIIDLPLPRAMSDFDFARWNDHIMLRLIALYYLPNSIEKILYMDSDTVVDGDIEPFYNDRGALNHAILGTKETLPWLKQQPIYPYLSTKTYLNSGVLVLNVMRWKALFPSLAVFLHAVRNIPFEITAIDQDIINYLFDQEKMAMPDDTFMRFCDGYHRINIDHNYRSKHPIVYHFAGVHKPWVTVGNPKYRGVWWKYARRVYPHDLQQRLKRERRKYIFGYPKRLLYRMVKKHASQ